MPPKTKQAALTTAEKIALGVLVERETRMISAFQELKSEYDQLISELEKRVRLPAGSVTSTHIVDGDLGMIRLRNGSDPAPPAD